ncbi:pyrimidine 5'-nucleotidase [Marinicauda sp. Alg238-R41]|uniref:pyrimidine 5'-nucleotidase n=1 Tax=Marinicauda sp. Alg238-R41 TaxID=2993447 RepID=UPI0022E3AC0D|nr:pyrimidine 5'-nucleotidase [Marinicauda sp. Alg238-R41]
MNRLDAIHTWVFDLDNTLYPSQAAVMSQVEGRMTEYVMKSHALEREDARKLQQRYYADYGTTLNGLMSNRSDVDIAHFLDFVHDIDHSVIDPDPDLAAHIGKIDGRRLVYTNGSRLHAERVIDQLGLNGLFEDLFDIEASRYVPKPNREGFDAFTGRYGIEPATAVMFEDSLRNLETAAELGFTTVFVRPHHHEGEPGEARAHVHFETDSLNAFLKDVHAHREKPKDPSHD